MSDRRNRLPPCLSTPTCNSPRPYCPRSIGSISYKPSWSLPHSSSTSSSSLSCAARTPGRRAQCIWHTSISCPVRESGMGFSSSHHHCPTASLPPSYHYVDMPLADLSRFIPSLFPPTDFLRLVIYCIFFLILFNFYSFPLHILRELFVTVTSFIKRLKDIIRARRATANLNTRWVDGHGSVGAA